MLESLGILNTGKFVLHHSFTNPSLKLRSNITGYNPFYIYCQEKNVFEKIQGIQDTFSALHLCVWLGIMVLTLSLLAGQ